MQYRRVPPPADVETLTAVWEAVPPSSKTTEDCCGRICARTEVDSREHASDWLVFLTALGCVEDDGGSYHRGETLPTVETLGQRFVSSVFGVDAVLAQLETDEALSPDDVLHRLEHSLRERIERAGDTSYVEQVLGWAVVFGHTREESDGYVHTTA